MALQTCWNSAYPPLPTDEPNIRVATIVKTTDDQLVFISRVQPLGQFPQQYIALSYTGIVSYKTTSRRDYSEVILNGQRVLISTELLVFLRKLSNLEKYGPFWCDALCIDQNNLREKNDQVALMTQVFFNANAVWAWLGDEADRSELALGITTGLAQNHETENIAEELDTYIEEFAVQPSDFIEALRWLFNRVYWTRIWIVQEVCFGSDVIFFCGSYWIPWDQLQRFSRYIDHVGMSSDSQYIVETATSGTTFAGIVLNLKKSRKALGAGPRLAEFSLAELVSALKDFHATDPRDKLFALHAMSREFHRKSLSFRPDYTKTRQALLWSCLSEADCSIELWLIAGSGLVKALDLSPQFRVLATAENSVSTLTSKRFLIRVYPHISLHQHCDVCKNVTVSGEELDRKRSIFDGSKKFKLFSILNLKHEFKKVQPEQEWWPCEILHTGIILWLERPQFLRSVVLNQDQNDDENPVYKYAYVAKVEVCIDSLDQRIDAPQIDPMPPLATLIGARVNIYRTRHYNTMTAACNLSLVQYAALLDFYRWVWRNLEVKGNGEPLIDAFEFRGDSGDECYGI